MVKRIFVEKKSGFDVATQHLYHDIKGYLGIEGVKKVRLLVRYDIEGISETDFQKALHTIFSEPPVDTVYESALTIGDEDTLFAFEYLPGQYDQRADSAQQCVQMIAESGSTQEDLVIKAAQVVVITGKISAEELSAIKNYLINPVDSHEAGLDTPETLHEKLDTPDDVASIEGFRGMSDSDLSTLRDELGLAMSEDDISHCQGYFRDEEKRDPSLTEIRMLDTYWSDHCRHTTFLTTISEVNFADGPVSQSIKAAFDSYKQARTVIYGDREKPLNLMDIALAGMKLLRKVGKLDDLEVSNEINACSIVVPAEIDGKTEEWLVMFKNETHNHPTEIEPFGGAATCLGGAIRDPLSGRSYVYQAMRVTGCGDPRKKLSETLRGKLPQRKITVEAAHGYSSYGNQIGLATGIVSEIYHEGYLAKRMEVGAVIAAAPRKNVVRGNPEPGDIVVLVGGRTGRDGCGGATGSSKEHTEDSIETCGAEVQKGNPPTERKIQRLFRNEKVARMIKVCNDFGAGGVSVAIGELADGLRIDLDAVPKKYEGLDGTELAISESQERMAVLISPDDEASFIAAAHDENLEAVKVADVTDEARVTMVWRGEKIVDISRDFINTNGVLQTTSISVTEPDAGALFFDSLPERLREGSLSDAWKSNLEDLNVCGQQGLVERFDSTIGAGSVLLPFGGKTQRTPSEAMAAKLPLLKGETTTATLMSFGFDPGLSSWSPYHGALYAVIHSAARIVAAGGDHRKIRLTLQEYFEKLGTDATRWGKPFAALLGAFTAQKELGIAAIGGKDSMSGTFENISVPPTLVSFAVAPTKADVVISGEFKEANHGVVYVKLDRDCRDLPDFGQVNSIFSRIHELILSGTIVSAYTIGTGGIAAAVSKMSFGNERGFSFSSKLSRDDLFGPQYGSFICEFNCSSKDIDKNDIESLQGTIIGETSDSPYITMTDMSLSVDELYQIWASPLDDVFPVAARHQEQQIPSLSFSSPNRHRPTTTTAQPRICIPVFPGTNCEYDTSRAFEKAGGIVSTVVIKNMTHTDIVSSLETLANEINRSQIVMLPGGFSAGDEPEGSGKFITSVFRNSRIADAVMELLQKRDGLMLGICNGFQALIKLGLVPYGEIRNLTEASPTLTFNTIGRHISRMVYTRISSTLSPWFSNVTEGDLHTIAISHGEGRFYAAPDILNSLVESGQVATQYADIKGVPHYSSETNPNGSVYAIEGITSPDGRVLGKMGHSERIGTHVAKNIYGEKDQKLFEAGIKYFK